MRKALSLTGIVVLTVFILSAGFIACRKTDHEPVKQKPVAKPPTKNFFFVSPVTENLILSIAQNIYRQNEEHGFVDDLTRRIGYPAWDYSMIVEGPGSARMVQHKENSLPAKDQRAIVYIPFAKESERQTRAVLMVVVDKGDTTFNLIYPQQYEQFGFQKKKDSDWDAQTLFSLFSGFDDALFGIQKYLVKDGRIFARKKEELLIVSPVDVGKRKNDVAAKLVSICATWESCVYADAGTGSGGNCVTITSCSTFWFEDGGIGTSFTGTFAYEGGSNDGNGTINYWYRDPCAATVRRPAEEPPVSDPGVSPCNTVPWIPLDDEIYNEVRDRCIRSMVDEVLKRDIKNQISTFINSTFGTNPTMDITIVDSALGNLITGDGLTNSHVGGSGACYILMMLNSSPGSLPGASQEYIAATIFHEAIHAWIIATNSKNNASNSVSHETMTSATNINMLADALKEMYPALSGQDCIDLAWGGLQETAKWTTLSQTDKDRINQTNFDYRNSTKGTKCIR